LRGLEQGSPTDVLDLNATGFDGKNDLLGFDVAFVVDVAALLPYQPSSLL